MADTTHNVGIRYSGDARGLVDAAKKGEESQKQLAAAFDQGREAQKKNSAEAETFVRRLKEQADTLKMTSQQVEMYRAAQLGLNDAQQRLVTSSLASIRAHEEHQRAIAQVRSLTIQATTAAVAYAGVLAAMGKSAINEADEINKLSQSLGMSAESLSVYAYAGKLANVSNEEFATGMKLLAKNIAEAQAGVGDGGRIFTVLGTQIEQAAKSGASMEQLLPMIAERFAQFADGPNKTALALATFGRAGERLIPFLNQGAAGIQAMRAEAEQLGIVISGETAKRAEEFNDNVTRMTTSITAFKYQVSEFLPVMNRYLELLVAINKYSNNPIQAAFIAAKSQMATSDIDARIAELEAATRGGTDPVSGWRKALRVYSPAVAAYDFVSGANESLQLQELAALRAMRGSRPGASQADVRAIDNAMGVSRPQAPFVPGADTGSGGALRAAAQSYQDKIDAEGRKAANDRGVALLKEAEESYKANAKAQLAAAEAASKWIAEQLKSIDGLNESNAKLKAHNEEIGLTAEQLGKLRVRREEDALALLRQEEAYAASMPGEENYLRLIQEQIKAQEQRIALTRDGEARGIEAERAKEAREEWKRTNDSIRDGLTDALMRGFDKGKSFGQNFFDQLKNMAKTLILEPTLRFLVSPISGAVTNVLGGLFGGGGSGGSGGGGLFGGGFPSPTSFMNFGGSGGGLFGQGSFLGSAISSSAQMAGLEAGLIGAEFGITGVGASTSLFGAGTGAMSVLGPAGLALGAAMLLGGGDDPLGGLFGGGGGPKDSSVKLFRRADGRFGLDVGNISDAGPSQAAFEAGPAASLTAALNDPWQYDPAKLASMVGEYQLGGPSTSANALAFLTQQLQPAAGAAAALTETLNSLTAAAAQAKQYLESISDLKLSDLSPLTAKERLDIASEGYSSVLARAQGGDAAAMQELSSSATTYLREARSYWASSPTYTGVFNQIQGDAATLQTSTQAAAQAETDRLAAAHAVAIEEQTRRLEEAMAAQSREAARIAAERSYWDPSIEAGNG